MTGIIGREPFKDYSVGERARGAGTVSVSEYGGTDSFKMPLGAGFDSAPSAFERLGTGFLDRLRSTVGAPTSVEIGAAARVKDEAHDSDRIDQRTAAAIADRLSIRSDEDIRRMLPTMGTDPIPRQDDLRWAAVATTAIDVVHRHVDHGDDNRLPSQLGRAVRLDAVLELRTTRTDAPVEEALKALSEQTADRTRRYLSHDAGMYEDMDRKHARLQEQGYVVTPPRQVRTEMAEARAGLMSPEHLVDRANRFGHQYERDRTEPHRGPVATPDFRNVGLERADREAAKLLVTQEMQRPETGRAQPPVAKVDKPVIDVTDQIRGLQAARAAAADRQNGR